MLQYTPKFRMKAVQENLQGKGSSQIFAGNVFDLTVIESDKPKENLKRWRKMFRVYYEERFLEEHRGKGRSTHQISESRKRVAKKARGTRKVGEETQLTLAKKFEATTTLV